MMRYRFWAALLACTMFSVPALAAGKATVVRLDTSMGKIEITLDGRQAPATVANFLRYVKEGFYKGTIFHRVIPGFMIQGGGFTSDLQQKPTHAPIRNEADNGLPNVMGAVAMARTSDPDSATAQFFINTMNNPSLNFRSKTPGGWGYTVFGHVTKGMDVVHQIEQVPTGNTDGMADVPLAPVVIESAEVLK
jgi:cyclophilin family peptidyl-prolyl cis-trans isomerase